jgi:uncharacterized protein YdeI (YjbR/CyaY-like superfamily)
MVSWLSGSHSPAEEKTRSMTPRTGPTRKSFTAHLEPDGTALNWVIARVPFDIAKAWPVRKGRRVRGEIEGFAFRTTLFADPRGSGHIVLVNKKMQSAANARVGSRVHIWLEPDLHERPIQLPPELGRIMNSDRALRRWFDRLSDSMRREIGKWTGEPKTAASREKHAEKIAERLLFAMEGQEEPPPVLRALFLRNPAARDGWFALTATQRRNHLLAISYYDTADARERRAAKAIEDALRAAKRKARPTRAADCPADS